MKKYLSGVVTGLLIALAFSICLAFAQRVYMRVSGVIPPERKLAEIVNILERNYIGELDMDRLFDGLFTGFVYGVGDPYTTYLPRAVFERYMQNIEGSFTGVGLFVTPEPGGSRVLVLSPIEGGPASEAGIRPNDFIIQVDGVNVSGDSLDQAIAMMRGPLNTEVILTVFRESTNETFDVTILRRAIDVPSVFPEMLENNIGYIRISSFEGTTASQFRNALMDFTSQGMEGLIIDVRNNPGGLLHSVAEIAGLLVPEGTIVYTEDRRGRERSFASDENYLGIPLVILVNQNSASASEILAGAVKDLGAGVLVGETTFGKGLVQSIYRLSDGSAVKVTVARYYTPSGLSINDVGIEPNYIVVLDTELSHRIASLEPEEDLQLLKAIEVIGLKME
ncbi:MAG: S41 family peptidase [Defluviitaleaceae bacterium]|nr:S41 family peptidase [Defluviitaleaceae bacterium]